MDLEQTKAWAYDFYKTLKRPCVVLLDGDLGAGKTQTAKWILEAAGSFEASSPTFAIHQEYVLPNGEEIDHVDLYRVTDDSDLESSGFWDLLRKENGLLLVEWAARLPEDVWPDAWMRVHVQISVEGSERRIETRRL